MVWKRRHPRRFWLISLALLWPLLASPPAAADNSDRFAGTVMFMRHALAPGIGDPDNFILLIIDNGSYGSTGDQPTYAGRKTSLAKVAEACGCDHVVECSAEDTPAAVKAALDGEKMTIIVSKCESGNIKVPVIDMDAPVIRDRFMREVARRNV